MSTKKRKTKLIDGILHQQCYSCKEGYPADVEHFTKNNRNPLGYTTFCRECKKKADKEYHAKIKSDPEKGAKTLQRANEHKRKNPNTRIGWTEYNNRPEVKERKSQGARDHCLVKGLSEEKYRKKILNNAKHRARRNGIPFNLDLDDIVIPDVCPLLETPLTRGDHNRGENPENTISLDKIIPELGYIKGNVRIISSLANTMKNNATKDQLLKFAKNIISYMKCEDIVQTIENKESIELEDKEPLS